MFRKIKKLYFKIYHLFKLIGVFIVVFGLWNNVYAIEYNNCFDSYKIGNYEFKSNASYWTTLNPLIPVTNDTTYYIKLFTGTEDFTTQSGTVFSSSPIGYNTAQGNLGNVNITNYSFDSTNQIYTFKTPTTPANLAYIQLSVYRYNTNYRIMENTPVVISTNREDLISCPSTPEPEPGDNVYSGFLTIYFDRIVYLAEGFTNNPYLIAMVGIIFGFVVLDLLLKIINIRRKK